MQTTNQKKAARVMEIINNMIFRRENIESAIKAKITIVPGCFDTIADKENEEIKKLCGINDVE